MTKQWMAACIPLVMAGCNQAPGTLAGPAATQDTIVVNGVSYTRTANAAPAPMTLPQGPSGSAAPQSPMAAPPAAAPLQTQTATIPAIGRWVRSGGECHDFGDIQFGPAAVTVYGPSGRQETDGAIFSNVTPTSFTITQAGKSQPFASAVLSDPSHMTLNYYAGGTPCMLVRQ